MKVEDDKLLGAGWSYIFHFISTLFPINILIEKPLKYGLDEQMVRSTEN